MLGVHSSDGGRSIGVLLLDLIVVILLGLTSLKESSLADLLLDVLRVELCLWLGGLSFGLSSTGSFKVLIEGDSPILLFLLLVLIIITLLAFRSLSVLVLVAAPVAFSAASFLVLLSSAV